MDVFIKRAPGERDREGLLKAIITRRLVEINLGVDEDETRDGGDDKCLSIKATVGLCWTGSLRAWTRWSVIQYLASSS